MTIILIVVMLVMALMNVAIFYILYSAVGVTKKQVQSCFVKELEDYNDYLNDKKIEVTQISEKKQEIEKKINSLEGVMVSLKTSPFYAPKKMSTELFVPAARYIDNEFFDAHKLVNDRMSNIDYDDLIRRIREKHPYVGDIKKYDRASELLEMLNMDVVYKLSLLGNKEQLDALYEAFDDYNDELLSDFLSGKSEEEPFDILEFRTYLREIRSANDPNMYIRVGSEKQLKEPKDNVIYQLDNNISEGIKIIFQNRNFDFSIYRLRSKK